MLRKEKLQFNLLFKVLIFISVRKLAGLTSPIPHLRHKSVISSSVTAFHKNHMPLFENMNDLLLLNTHCLLFNYLKISDNVYSPFGTLETLLYSNIALTK